MDIEEIKLKYPRGFESVVQMTKDELEFNIRLMAALKMFELGKVSMGKAAELAGMSKTEFMENCGRYKVSVFNYKEKDAVQELKDDLETLRNMTS